MARRGLGKGLDALIPVEAAVEPASGAQQIPIGLIKPNPSQPRMEMDDDQISGIIQLHP